MNFLLLLQLNHSLNMLQQKWDSGTPSVTMALVPLAVCLASTILQKKDLEYSIIKEKIQKFNFKFLEYGILVQRIN